MFFGKQIVATFYLATWTKRRIVLKVSPSFQPGKVRGWGWHDPLQWLPPVLGPATLGIVTPPLWLPIMGTMGEDGLRGQRVTSIWSFKWVIYPLLLFIITYHTPYTRWWWWKQKVMYSLLCSGSVPSPICHRDLSQPSELCPPRLMAGRSKIVKLCHVVYYRQTCKTCLTMFSLVCAQHLRLKRRL